MHQRMSIFYFVRKGCLMHNGKKENSSLVYMWRFINAKNLFKMYSHRGRRSHWSRFRKYEHHCEQTIKASPADLAFKQSIGWRIHFTAFSGLALYLICGLCLSHNGKHFFFSIISILLLGTVVLQGTNVEKSSFKNWHFDTTL